MSEHTLLRCCAALLTLLMPLSLLTGCGSAPADLQEQEPTVIIEEPTVPPAPPEDEAPPRPVWAEGLAAEDLPEPPVDKPFTVINDHHPYFTAAELSATASYEQYSPLDSLGRCGTAMACIGRDLMPTEERGSIGQVKPSGWHTVKYDCVDGKYLYNRCHLLGYQLTGENANVENLITGTRSMNTEGMLPFENLTADYVEETGNHVLYRVTPVFIGDELVARGVLMEGRSLEDGGAAVCFCALIHNVQPGIVIDYATGESQAASTHPRLPLRGLAPSFLGSPWGELLPQATERGCQGSPSGVWLRSAACGG